MKSFKLFFGLFTLFLVSISFATVPQLINFQGRLTNNSGSPLANDTLSVEFKIYDAVVSGNVKWSEIDTIITDANGLFTILLGNKNPIPDSVFNDSLRWLGIKVGSDPEISPRQRLGSVGYALQSGQWNSSGNNIYRDSGNVGIGTSTPNAKLGVIASSSTGVFAFSASGTGVFGEGSLYGLYGNSNGTGVYGAGPQYGVHGNGYNGTGVYGTGDTAGVSGQSVSGTGVRASSGNGPGVVASGFTNAVEATGGTRGVYATGGTYGVVASGGSYGVYGVSSSGAGVYASGSTNGIEATGGTRGVYAGGGTYGVVGFATSNVFPSYGIYGSDNGTPVTTYAGFFSGQVKITSLLEVDGFIFKDGGGFKIDHPTDPANKYLYHSFVESPDMKNIYDGVVTIDAKGEAIVTLPDWFGAVNKDFRYQLTAIGAPGPNLYIAEEISKNQFKIGGGTAGMKVSWQVTGIRKDAYAEAHRIPVEEVKSDKERGKYRHPEVLGLSETLGMHYEETQKIAAEHKQMEEQKAKMEQELKGTDKK